MSNNQSYYVEPEGLGTTLGADDDDLHEVRCNRCHGSGMDRDEADCINCSGYGTLLVPLIR